MKQQELVGMALLEANGPFQVAADVGRQLFTENLYLHALQAAEGFVPFLVGDGWPCRGIIIGALEHARSGFRQPKEEGSRVVVLENRQAFEVRGAAKQA